MSASLWLSLLLGVSVVACDYPRPADVPDDDAPAEAGVPADASGSSGDANDGPPIDGPPIDGRPVLTLDCSTYCSTISTSCTGANTQYADASHCMATCNKFAMGNSSDTGGQNTLGCRLYHAQNAMLNGMPEVYCPNAGPAGSAISTANPQPAVCGDACTGFCTLEISICGSLDAPISTVPAQYQNMATCMTACGGATIGFNKSKPLVTGATNSSGDSLACRLYHITNAAISGNAAVHCPHTGPNGGTSAATCMIGTPPAP
jgi:hypothetical protein